MLIGQVDLVSRSEVIGWVLDTAAPNVPLNVVISVDSCVRGIVEANLPREKLSRANGFEAGRLGFIWRFQPPLSDAAAYAVAVCYEADGRPLDDGVQRLYAKQSLAETFSRSTAGLELRPVLVTSFGRSGSSLLMHRLSLQPEIVVPGGWPYETKLATYYANAYRLLTEYEATGARANPNEMANASCLGAMPFVDATKRFPGFFRRYVPPTLGDCMRRLITGFYQEVASVEGRRASRLFAEKCDFAEDTRAILQAMFPDLLEIVLIRDLRDLYCSSRAFWDLAERAGLSRIQRARKIMLDLHDASDPGILLLRYEDLVRDPIGTGLRLTKFLDLTVQFAINPVVEATMFATHATSTNPLSSIGRWIREPLPASVRALLAEADAFNRTFGYSDHIELDAYLKDAS